MNTRPTEIRTADDVRAQIELERMLAARRAADAAREARFRTLPTPRSQLRAAVKAPMADLRPEPKAPLPQPVDDSPLLTMCCEVLAGLVVWALFGLGVIKVIEWVLS